MGNSKSKEFTELFFISVLFTILGRNWSCNFWRKNILLCNIKVISHLKRTEFSFLFCRAGINSILKTRAMSDIASYIWLFIFSFQTETQMFIWQINSIWYDTNTITDAVKNINWCFCLLVVKEIKDVTLCVLIIMALNKDTFFNSILATPFVSNLHFIHAYKMYTYLNDSILCKYFVYS